MNKSPHRILVLSATFPSIADPNRGVFVKERIKALHDREDMDVRVVAPVPWFPPIRLVESWYKCSQYPAEENFEGLQVYHPRYPLPPKVGGYFHAELMYLNVRRWCQRIRREFKFDLIDSHFVYPSGVVAAKLARHFSVPVVMTGRGEDMIRFPGEPVIGDRIRWALGQSTQCVGVSKEIADAMLENGSEPEKTTVIANGIDCEKFRRIPMQESRQHLKLPADRKIILTVGEMIPRKGFDLLIQAMPEILRSHPDAILVIVGRKGRFGRDITDSLKQQIADLDLGDHVVLAGSCPHQELIHWYNATDLFVLMSASEGSPNVLLEAFACGTPAVATPVGGIPDEFSDDRLGILLPERSAAAAAEAVAKALGKDWDRDWIAERMRQRT